MYQDQTSKQYTGLSVGQIVLLGLFLSLMLEIFIQTLPILMGIDFSPVALEENNTGIFFRIWMVVSQVVGFALPVFLLNRWRIISFQQSNFQTRTLALPAFVFLIGAYLAYQPFILYTSFNPETFSLPNGFESMEVALENIEQDAKATIAAIIFEYLPLNLLAIAVAPAFCEEIFFRGFLQRELHTRLNPFWAIVLGGFLFSLMHFQVYGFIGRWVLGIIFGLAYFFGKSLWYPIVLHFLNNAAVVVFSWWRGEIIEDFGQSSFSIGETILVFVSLGIAILATTYFVSYVSKSEQSD